MLESSYTGNLVVFSFLVAILASYTALSMAVQIRRTEGRAALGWLAGGGFAMGVGIWSMHFIGMLAFSLPIDLGYDLTLTLVSLVAAIAASTFALWVACRRALTVRRLMSGALIMGVGVGAMHYIGMEAMMMLPRIVYHPGWFALSVLVAISASGAALWMTSYIGRADSRRWLLKIGAAVVISTRPGTNSSRAVRAHRATGWARGPVRSSTRVEAPVAEGTAGRSKAQTAAVNTVTAASTRAANSATVAASITRRRPAP